MATTEPPRILTIEWEMMDKTRFFSVSMANSFALHGLLYPFTVVKTRLQVQRQNAMYSGTFDAFVKILKYEGFGGLYRGFWINSIQIASGIGYITTYEKVRHALGKYANVTDGRIKGLVGGACGSVVGQTFITPFEVVSQHLMIMGQLKDKNSATSSSVVNPLNIKPGARNSSLALEIMKKIYQNDGLKGFYRGFFASLYTNVPSSALWWMFYPIYSGALVTVFPLWMPHTLIHCFGGQMSAVTVAVLTNPFDVIRARIQVNRMNSFSAALSKVWLEEGVAFVAKGILPRMMQAFFSTFFLVLSYESIKRLSVHDQYKDEIRW